MRADGGVAMVMDESRIGNLDAGVLRRELLALTKAVNVLTHLSSGLDIASAYNNVHDVALELLDCERVTLFLVFDRRKELRAQIEQNNLEKKETEKVLIRVKFGSGIAGTVAQTGTLMNIEDAYSHPLFNPAVDKTTGYRTNSLLCCAIRDMSGKNVAVLQALNKCNGGKFSVDDERNLRLFGAHLGNTLAKSKLHEHCQREKDRLSSLFQYFKALNSASDLSKLLQTVSSALHKVLHAEHAFVFIMDAPRSELWMQCSLPPPTEDYLSVRVRVGEGLVGQCGLDHAKPNNIQDYAGDDELLTQVLDPMLKSQTKSVLVQPVFGNDHSGKVAAVILAINKREVGSESDIFFEDYFTESDVDAMALFAMEVGDALAARSLEASFASALSVVTLDGMAPTRSQGSTSGAEGEGPYGEGQGHGCGEADNGWQLRSQLMNMYLKGASEPGPEPLATTLATPHRSVSHWHSENKLSVTRITPRAASEPMRGGATSGVSVGGDGAASGSASSTTGGAGAGGSSAGGPERPSIRHRRTVPQLLPQLLQLAYPTSNPNALPSSPSNSDQSITRSVSAPTSFSLPASAAGHGGGGGGGGLAGPVLERMQQLSEELGAHGGVGSEDGPLAAEGAGGQRAGPGLGRVRRRSSLYQQVEDARARGFHVSADGVTWDGELSSGSCGGAAAAGSIAAAAAAVLAAKAEEGPSRPREPAAVRAAAAVDGEVAAWGSSGRLEAACRAGGEAGAPETPRDRAASPVRVQGGGKVTWQRRSSAQHLPQMGEGAAVEAGATSVVPPLRQPSRCFNELAVLASWEYDFTEAGIDTLFQICHDIFIFSGVVEHFHLNMTTLAKFLTAVSSHYHKIPYHNFNHVVHVLHTTWMILQTPTASKYLTMEDRLAVLIAALCHDMDHDGRSNSFHMHTQSELARLYNDRSIMENHHCAMTFEVLRRKECALLDDLDKEVRQRLRHILVGAILSTDMTCHFGLTQDFKNHSTEFDPSKEADRQLLVKVILHSADIGNAVRPFHINQLLSHRVHEEFMALAAEESSMGIPVTFPIDANNTLVCAECEINFLDYIVAPLWYRLVEVLPELAPAAQVDRTIRNNRTEYLKVATPLGAPPPINVVGSAEAEEDADAAPEAGTASDAEPEAGVGQKAGVALGAGVGQGQSGSGTVVCASIGLQAGETGLQTRTGLQGTAAAAGGAAAASGEAAAAAAAAAAKASGAEGAEGAVAVPVGSA